MEQRENQQNAFKEQPEKQLATLNRLRKKYFRKFLFICSISSFIICYILLINNTCK